MKNSADEIKNVLRKRGETYGNFSDNAVIAQGLKEVIRNGESWGQLTYYQREALDMACSKIARAVNGNTLYEDNWVDLVGYFQLALDELRRSLREEQEGSVYPNHS